MTSPGMINALVYTGISVMCVFNYAVAILADPGWVPSAYMPDIEDSKVSIHEIKRKGGDLRYCQKCSHFKPPRAHHCRICKSCILRMDHHCVWINNCVGHANYKAFFVSVVYAVIACFYSLVLLVGSLNIDSRINEQQRDSFRTVYVVSGLFLLPFSVALSVLLGWHIYLILQNKTTIEQYHEGVRTLCLAEKGGTVYQHPYDLGTYENLLSVITSNGTVILVLVLQLTETRLNVVNLVHSTLISSVFRLVVSVGKERLGHECSSLLKLLLGVAIWKGPLSITRQCKSPKQLE
ncbi:putative protein S-acyltransferase 16 [Hibiscus syriacus]|uniref:S-acyltransferase n=1 Tax=Hibiscus syriacus TaxID=106335 RepID=A0A6A3B2Z9_HIBSY|nr:putative protein S-acyltransferase 16 [Hibiscus syriacus]